MDLSEADIDLIEGDGERNVLNWLYDHAVPAWTVGDLDRRALYARYLADKPAYIAGTGGLTRTDAEAITRAGRLYDERIQHVPRYVSPSGQTLAEIVQLDHRRRSAPEPA